MADKTIKRDSFMDAGTIQNVTNLSDIPLGSFGYISFSDASISPKNNTSSMFAYMCFGILARRSIIASYTAGTVPETYVNVFHTDTWKGWQKIAPQPQFYVKDYSMTLASNSNVTPFSTFVELNISNDISTYGTPISALPFARSVNPVAVRMSSTSIFVAGKTEETITVRVTFQK